MSSVGWSSSISHSLVVIPRAAEMKWEEAFWVIITISRTASCASRVNEWIGREEEARLQAGVGGGGGIDQKIRTIIIRFYCAADTTHWARWPNNITINTFILQGQEEEEEVASGTATRGRIKLGQLKWNWHENIWKGLLLLYTGNGEEKSPLMTMIICIEFLRGVIPPWRVGWIECMEEQQWIQSFNGRRQ